MPIITQAGVDEILRRLKALEERDIESDKRIQSLETYSFIGNGRVAFKEHQRTVEEWMKDNKELPETVRTQGRWIQNVNKMGWAIILLLLGILVTNAVGVYNAFIRTSIP